MSDARPDGFADGRAALRVERAEALAMRAMVRELVGSTQAPGAFVREVGLGFATYVRPRSPLNKLIGVGLDEPIDETVLGEVERAFDDLREPLRAEIATIAAPRTWERLTARGYRLIGFENVLAVQLERAARRSDPSSIRVDRVTAATSAELRQALVEGAAISDETGAVIERLSHETIATAIDDALVAQGPARYLAYRDDVLAGGASMLVCDDVAVLTGSATRPQHRRCGVQAALLARRLDDARAAGASLAIITTAPATRSQANAMRLGFSLIYARASLEHAC